LTPTRVSHNAWNRAFAWILLGTTLASVAQPLALASRRSESSGYARWLLDRGASEVDETLTDALRVAATGRHTSLEAFVQEFVRAVAEQGALDQASMAFQGPSDSAIISESDLAALILADLRALSPKDPNQLARLSPGDSAALFAASRHAAHFEAGGSRERVAIPASVPLVERPVAAGLMTTIQSLGP
jgi:hypothetical protein